MNVARVSACRQNRVRRGGKTVDRGFRVSTTPRYSEALDVLVGGLKIETDEADVGRE